MNSKAYRKPFIVVIVGPTASGKSDLAVKLAQKLNGEIVSADSRQVYKGLNLGSGKITKKEMRSITHHLIDIADPKKTFSAAEFKKLGEKAIAKIIKKGKLPIVCGGTGFYIQALVDGLLLPEVPPNLKLRKSLEKKSIQSLFSLLQKIDLRRAKEIDKNNPRRLIRAIEIAKALGKNPKLKSKTKYSALFIGIRFPMKELRKRIQKRLLKRIKDGMIEEVKDLPKKGLSWGRLEDLGLEYRYVAKYLQSKINKKQMIEELNKAIFKFAKRQMTWFKRDKRICWINPK